MNQEELDLLKQRAQERAYSFISEHFPRQFKYKSFFHSTEFARLKKAEILEYINVQVLGSDKSYGSYFIDQDDFKKRLELNLNIDEKLLEDFSAAHFIIEHLDYHIYSENIDYLFEDDAIPFSVKRIHLLQTSLHDYNRVIKDFTSHFEKTLGEQNFSDLKKKATDIYWSQYGNDQTDIIPYLNLFGYPLSKYAHFDKLYITKAANILFDRLNGSYLYSFENHKKSNEKTLTENPYIFTLATRKVIVEFVEATSLSEFLSVIASIETQASNGRLELEQEIKNQKGLKYLPDAFKDETPTAQSTSLFEDAVLSNFDNLFDAHTPELSYISYGDIPVYYLDYFTLFSNFYTGNSLVDSLSFNFHTVVSLYKLNELFYNHNLQLEIKVNQILELSLVEILEENAKGLIPSGNNFSRFQFLYNLDNGALGDGCFNAGYFIFYKFKRYTELIQDTIGPYFQLITKAGGNAISYVKSQVIFTKQQIIQLKAQRKDIEPVKEVLDSLIVILETNQNALEYLETTVIATAAIPTPEPQILVEKKIINKTTEKAPIQEVSLKDSQIEYIKLLCESLGITVDGALVSKPQVLKAVATCLNGSKALPNLSINKATILVGEAIGYPVNSRLKEGNAFRDMEPKIEAYIKENPYSD